jgi:site-specific recombinase XerD
MLVHGAERAEAFARASRAENTSRGYASDWRSFQAWCDARGLASLPADPRSIALYIADLAVTHKPATITRHLAAVAAAHKARGFESPCSMRHGCVSSVLHGIRRTMGTAQVQKAPLLIANIRAIAENLPDRLIGTRDRALLLVGFASACRRSEIVALDVEDLQFTSDGLVVTLRRSKTDQVAQGRKVGLPFGSNPDTCPVRSLKAWIDASAITTGPLFVHIDRHGKMHNRLSGSAVAEVVKRHAGSAGLDTSKFAAHSLRAGLATAAAIAGASERSIMNQTGHKSAAMARRYIRDASLFRENAAAVVGL